MPAHLALPIGVAPNGALTNLPQDSPAEIAQSVALLISTRPGERRSVPDYGVEDPLGGGVDAVDLAETIAEWEERADPALVEATAQQAVEQYVVVHPADPDPTTTEEA